MCLDVCLKYWNPEVSRVAESSSPHKFSLTTKNFMFTSVIPLPLARYRVDSDVLVSSDAICGFGCIHETCCTRSKGGRRHLLSGRFWEGVEVM